MRKQLPNKVIIWGIDNYNTLGLFRQLAPYNVNVFFLIFGKLTGCASASKWCTDSYAVNSIEEGADYLFSHFKDEKAKPIIITPGDGIIEYIDQHKDKFQQYFLVPGTKEPGLLTHIDNKNNMGEIAERLGFIVPQSMVCKYDTDISCVKYPCILKPSHLKEGHYNEFKFKICNKESELRNTLKYVNKDSEFILQQYIPKERDFLVYGCRLIDGTCLIAGVLIRDRFVNNGETSHGIVSSNLPDSIDVLLIEKFLKEIDYHGLFSVEYGDYDNKAYFFEVNLRNDGTSHFFYQAGANIPLAWVCDFVGIDYSDVCTYVKEDKWYIDEVTDIGNVLTGNISWKQWRKDKAKATIFKFYDKDDPAPLRNMKRGRWKVLLKSLLLSKFRIYIVYLLDRIKRK